MTQLSACAPCHVTSALFPSPGLPTAVPGVLQSNVEDHGRGRGGGFKVTAEDYVDESPISITRAQVEKTNLGLVCPFQTSPLHRPKV